MPSRAASLPSSLIAFLGADPRRARICDWADEDPEAMRRLLEDAELRALLARALVDLGRTPDLQDGARHAEARA